MFLRTLCWCTLFVTELHATLTKMKHASVEDSHWDSSAESDQTNIEIIQLVPYRPPPKNHFKWGKLLMPPKTSFPPATKEQVERLAEGLLARVSNLQGRDRDESEFVLSMASQYPKMATLAQNVLYQRLNLLYIAAYSGWTAAIVAAQATAPSAAVLPPGFALPTQKPNMNQKCEDSVKVKLLIGEFCHVSMYDMFANQNKPLSVDKNFGHFYSIDYHFKKNIVIYSPEHYIYRGHLVGDKVTESTLIADVIYFPKAAVDWVHDNVYFAVQNGFSVQMAELDGANKRLLFDGFENIFPNNLAVDPYEGYLFFVSIGYIYRCNLEGKELKQLNLVNGKQGRVRDLTLDTHKKRLYYAYVVGDKVNMRDTVWQYDYNTGREVCLASCSYDGVQGEDHPLAKHWSDMRSLQVFRGTVYFAENSLQGNAVWSADLAQNPAVPVRRYSSGNRIDSIRVYHPSVQKLFDEVSCA